MLYSATDLVVTLCFWADPLPHSSIHLFVRSFLPTDLFTTISHE